MDNRYAGIVDGCVTWASGQAERTAALAVIENGRDLVLAHFTWGEVAKGVFEAL